jgi:DNA recombination protein RmuC
LISGITVLACIVGAVLGGVLAWLLAKAGFQRQAGEIEARARSAEAIADERLRQVGQKAEEAERLGAELMREQGEKVEALTRLTESEKRFKEELARFEAVRAELSENFKSLSLDALTRNTEDFKKYGEDFIKIAEEKLRSQTAENKQEMESKKDLIGQSVESIGKTLSEVQKRIEDVGKTSSERLAEVSTLIRKHEEVTEKLRETTDHLGQALVSSKKRGEWGERMAEDIMRLVGMIEGVNYIKQKTLESTQNRPDYTFLLPNDLKLNMDVKFPMENYRSYLEAESDGDRRRFREELVRNVRNMIKQVTTRDYIDPSQKTVDYVILFIPNEQVYAFVNEADTAIMDDALKRKVVLCSPFTLYAVLAVVRQAAENFNLERTASEIIQLLGEFSKQWSAYKERFKVMGERLDAARKEYDALVTTRTNMLERPLRKVEEIRKSQAIAIEGGIELDEGS